MFFIFLISSSQFCPFLKLFISFLLIEINIHIIRVLLVRIFQVINDRKTTGSVVQGNTSKDIKRIYFKDE